jgi:hypothetical protein
MFLEARLGLGEHRAPRRRVVAASIACKAQNSLYRSVINHEWRMSSLATSSCYHVGDDELNCIGQVKVREEEFSKLRHDIVDAKASLHLSESKRGSTGCMRYFSGNPCVLVMK